MYETEVSTNRHTLAFINHGVNLGLITGANLNGLTTVTGLIAAINAVTGLHETDENIRRQLVDQLTIAKHHGLLTDADVTGVAGEAEGDRIAALRALFTARDALEATHARSFAHQVA